MHLHEALAAYEGQAVANGRSQHSVLQSRRHVRALSNWLTSSGQSADVAELDHSDIANFMGSDQALLRPDGKRKKPVSLNALRSSLRTFFAYTNAAGMTPTNPARLLRRAVCAPPPPRALSAAEQRKLLSVLNKAASPPETRDRLCFLLQLRAGLRLGSVVALDAIDIDFDEGRLGVRLKGGREDQVFVPREVLDELRRFLAGRDEGPVFIGPSGRRLTTRHLQRRFARLRERAGLPANLSSHGLRHTFATQLLEKTGDLELVRKALSHKSISSTTIYARCGDARLREAIGV